MTITYGAHGRVVEFDLDTTVGINLPAPQPDPSRAHTVRITPPYRRPAAVGESRIRIPRTIGIVDSPLDTGQLPAFAAYTVARHRAPVYAARHRRTWRTVLAARLLRLFGFGRRDGA
jgi:hypothetical protein